MGFAHSKYLPGTGRGTATRSVGVEGQAQVFAISKGQEYRQVPLHHASHGPPPRAGEVLVLLLFVSAFLAQPLQAQGTGPTPELANQQLSNPAQEAEATELMESLRCIQCQSQSIADSDAPMAASMRAEVRQQIASGKKADDVRQWMIQRYGQWVSFEPETRGVGLLLWLAPLLLLAVALLLARGLFRRPE